MSGKRLVLWCQDGVLIPEGAFDDEIRRRVCGSLVDGHLDALAPSRGLTTLRAVSATLRLHGLDGEELAARTAQAGPLLIEAWRERRAELIASDRVPGATEVLLALRMRGDVRQSLLSPDPEDVARLKANAFEFDRYLDAIDLGGYGSDGEELGELIVAAQGKSRAVYNGQSDAVVIAWTPEEVTAAVKVGVGLVAVAGDPERARELRVAGAEHILADLTDTDAALAAIDAA